MLYEIVLQLSYG